MKSPIEQLTEYKGKIVWLVSYPKSGNTWFRCFLSALFYGSVDINRINTEGIFSDRRTCDLTLDIDSRLLTEDESLLRQSKIYTYLANLSPRLQWIKVHDAYSLDTNKKLIFPKEVTHKVIYLVRNPLDVVGSFANHMACPINRAIFAMNKKDNYLANTKGLNTNPQFPQKLFDWSGHVNSWLDQKRLEVEVVRYEDMKKKPTQTFSRVMKSLGLKIKRDDIKQAIDLTQFEKLKKAESEHGFQEKHARSKAFFRKGQSGGWVDELTKEQAGRIINVHSKTMQKLGYKIPNLDKVYKKNTSN